ncbi:MAG: hypothetical protein OER96_00405 [Gammaproteobacteria bacterium]|nr:hypothetical protein [Gammaproteobacteria bacterium]
MTTPAESDDPVIQYVINLDETCAYDDGYVCIEDVVEDQFGTPESNDKMMSGAYLKAYSVSEKDFMSLSDLSEEQRRLKHYKIGFTENATDFIVIYRALILPNLIDGKPDGFSFGTFGITTKYWIDKQTYAIKDRKFYR